MANYQELANLVWNVADDVLRRIVGTGAEK